MQLGILRIAYRHIQQAIHIQLERHTSVQSGLEVVVVRSRRAATGAVVEESVALIVPCQVQHIHITGPDGLFAMGCQGNHQMIGENGVRVDQYVVALALAALESKVELLCRTVLAAEETGPGLEGSRVRLCRGRHYPGRIMLQLHLQSPHRELLDLHTLECPEVVTGQSPAGQLVPEELVQLAALVFGILHIQRLRALRA